MSASARDKAGPPGWLIGVIAVVIIALIGGAGAFAYFKFLKPAPQQAAADTSAPASAPVATAPGVSGPVASAMAVSSAPASTTGPAAVQQAAAPVPEPVVPANGVASATSQAVAAPPVPATTPPPAAAPAPQAEPPVDQTLKIAADLVRKGEREYSQGDYEEAVRHARSALDVRTGYAPAQQLLRRAYAAQKQVSAQQQREQQLAAEQQQAQEQAQAQAAAAAARPKPPTPDDVYNQRAHSECARGLFGKACRHKIRVEVCAGVAAGAPGTSVCKEQD